MNYPVYNPYMNASYPVQQQMVRQDMQNQQIMQQQMMGQQMMNQQQAQPQVAIPALSPASRPVTSREEAIAVQADFSGAPMVFPDITHNCVYIKRWNIQTGAAEFTDFVPTAATVAQNDQAQEQPSYATLQALADLKNTVDDLEQQVELLKEQAGKSNGKAGKKNDAE